MLDKAAIIIIVASIYYALADEGANQAAAATPPAAPASPPVQGNGQEHYLDLVFDIIDSNNDQKVSLTEAERFYLAAGAEKAEIDEQFKKADKNKDNLLSKEEFKEYAKNVKLLDYYDPIVIIYDAIDSNDDKEISIDEAVKFYALLGIPREEVEKLFKSSDKNGDGKLSLEEFTIHAHDVKPATPADKKAAPAA